MYYFLLRVFTLRVLLHKYYLPMLQNLCLIICSIWQWHQNKTRNHKDIETFFFILFLQGLYSNLVKKFPEKSLIFQVSFSKFQVEKFCNFFFFLCDFIKQVFSLCAFSNAFHILRKNKKPFEFQLIDLKTH